MAQKFIITRRGLLRMGDVAMHRDLLHHMDACLGGGFYRFDPVSCRLVLSGRSYDFGYPVWSFLIDNHIALKVPRAYQGLAIIYLPDDPAESPTDISREMVVEYY